MRKCYDFGSKAETDYRIRLTAYFIGTNIDGTEMDIPTLVPTLSPEEIELMKTDIVPTCKKVSDVIFRKALDHAVKQPNAGKSIWASR